MCDLSFIFVSNLDGHNRQWTSFVLSVLEVCIESTWRLKVHFKVVRYSQLSQGMERAFVVQALSHGSIYVSKCPFWTWLGTYTDQNHMQKALHHCGVQVDVFKIKICNWMWAYTGHNWISFWRDTIDKQRSCNKPCLSNQNKGIIQVFRSQCCIKAGYECYSWVKNCSYVSVSQWLIQGRNILGAKLWCSCSKVEREGPWVGPISPSLPSLV